MEFERYPLKKNEFVSSLLLFAQELGINPGMIEVIPEGDIIKIVIQENVAAKLSPEQLNELMSIK